MSISIPKLAPDGHPPTPPVANVEVDKTCNADGFCTKKLTVLLVWPAAVTVTAWLPVAALAATAKSTTTVVLLVDFTVAAIPVPGFTVTPVRPVPVIVTDEVVTPIRPRGGEMLLMEGATFTVAWTVREENSS
jgi:hypothetical protein